MRKSIQTVHGYGFEVVSVLGMLWDRLYCFLERVTSCFRYCGICGSHAVNNQLFCEPCLDGLRRRIHSRGAVTSGYNRDLCHSWLMTWRRQDMTSKRLAHALKGGGFYHLFLELAVAFVRGLEGPLPEQTTLVYPTKGPKDHASYWAQALSEVTGYPVQALRKADSSKQSLKRREERMDIEFISLPIPPKNVVFVDDIVTTGSTAQAAYKGLAQPENFVIWSIFYRPNL